MELMKSNVTTVKDVNHHVRNANGCFEMQSHFSFVRIVIHATQAKASIMKNMISRIIERELHGFALTKPGQANTMAIVMHVAANTMAKESVKKNLQDIRTLFGGDLIGGWETMFEITQCERNARLMRAAMECWGHSEKRI